MGDRIEKDVLIAIAAGMILFILFPIIVNFIQQKLYEHNCDTMPITDAWRDDRCKEYFKRDLNLGD